MKYLKHFDDRSEYDNYIGGDSVYLPNVSLVNGEEHSLFKNSEGVERIVRQGLRPGLYFPSDR